MSEKKMVGRSVASALGVIWIVLGAGLGVVLFIQIQNQNASLNALRTEMEKSNVDVVSYSWQDSPYYNSTTVHLLSFNCTLMNTGLQTANDVHIGLTIHYVDGSYEEDFWSPNDIPARQTAILTGMNFVHNNTSATNYITIETDWLGGKSENIVNTW